ncbi:SDR family oxidoreductase [Arenibaculum pallidiluteum]|uniref:SDR family oxidoreductase n=1 Tax=Arenibaculum pallidiluteum TaxID=2812559 RepID=UPI001A963F5D|nr:SDR family oxidoreductase [Arenibaculum pallidiluteum]
MTGSEAIAGKVVVITGASSGIGEATARHLAGLGAKVVLGARRRDRLETVAADIRAAGGIAEALVTDVARREQVVALAALAESHFGRIDVMVNNAGLMPLSTLDQRRVEDWERMIDVNLKGVLYGIAAALPAMQRQGGGHIVCVSSTAGLRVRPTMAVYSATKFAVRAIAEGLRQEATAHNIRSTVISPGPVDTELPNSVTDPEAAEATRAVHARMAIPALSVAQAIAFAIAQPPEVDVNEIVLRPTLMS